MYNTCIICGTTPRKIVRNTLPMYQCKKCHLAWRADFDVPLEYYKGSNILLDDRKLQERIINSFDRIDTFSKYIELNNLCDIGSGEGMFLKALQRRGYMNIWGLEPNEAACAFAQKQGLDIVPGFIDNLPDMNRKKDARVFTMLHLIEHLQGPHQSLELLYHSMRPGSYLIIETPNIDAYSVKKKDFRHPLIYQEHLFYFNPETLRALLEKSGFVVVAHGKRDFESNEKNIRHLLFKAGVGDFSYQKSSAAHCVEETPSCPPAIPRESKIRKSVKSILRKILQGFIHLSGREDYMWFIVRKPHTSAEN